MYNLFNYCNNDVALSCYNLPKKWYVHLRKKNREFTYPYHFQQQKILKVLIIAIYYLVIILCLKNKVNVLNNANQIVFIGDNISEKPRLG